MKNILVISDLHCGHKAGLTPPGFLPTEGLPLDKVFISAAKEYWNFFESGIRTSGPFDIVIVNGDLIDGKGRKSGGTELWTTDMEGQCDMATAALRKIPVKKGVKFIITKGTSYHVGEAEDWENLIASRMDAQIGDHLWADIEGVVFDLKHHPAGSSGIPQGRHTGVAKDRLWNLLWSRDNIQPDSQVFIRSHVHYHNHCGGPDWLAMTTPALQGFGSKFGARRCSGQVDFGFVTFQVNKGTYSWQAHIAKLPTQKAKALKF
jgi:hypothetical protein